MEIGSGYPVPPQGEEGGDRAPEDVLLSLSSLSPAARVNEALALGIAAMTGTLRGALEIQARIDRWMVATAAKLSSLSVFHFEDDHGAINVVAEEIAMAMGISRIMAERYVKVGRAVEGPLFALGDAMENGVLALDKAWAITDALSAVPVEVAVVALDAVLPRAAERTPAELRRDVARALIEVDPEGADKRHARAAARRSVSRPRREAEGMASMRLVLPAQAAFTLDAALDACAAAARRAGDPRTSSQLRADAVTDWATGLLRDGWQWIASAEAEISASPYDGVSADPRSAHGQIASSGSSSRCCGPASCGSDWPALKIGPVPAAIKVTVPLEVLAQALPGWQAPATPLDLLMTDVLGTAQSADDERTGQSAQHSPGKPAEQGAGHSAFHGEAGTASEVLESRCEAPWLEGYGPIAPATARLLAAGGTWRRIVTDSLTGAPLDIGRARYTPPPQIAEAVRFRDPVCARPGCSIPSGRCELDHVTPWHQGGTTSLDNLAPLCPRCHRIKSLGAGQESHVRPGGTRTWSTPGGAVYATLPERTPRAAAWVGGVSTEQDLPPF